MARVYLITEAEMQSLLDQLKLEQLQKNNILVRPGETPSQAIEDTHRAFHYVCVRWAQDMGFKGYRP